MDDVHWGFWQLIQPSWIFVFVLFQESIHTYASLRNPILDSGKSKYEGKFIVICPTRKLTEKTLLNGPNPLHDY